MIDAKIKDNCPRLSDLIQTSVEKVAKEMLEVELITEEVNPSVERILEQFIGGLKWCDDQAEVEEHCIKFLKVLEKMKGNFGKASKKLRDQWTEAAKCELGISLSLDS